MPFDNFVIFYPNENNDLRTFKKRKNYNEKLINLVYVWVSMRTKKFTEANLIFYFFN